MGLHKKQLCIYLSQQFTKISPQNPKEKKKVFMYTILKYINGEI